MTFIEVDQSGKVEQFDRDTVVALSNHTSHSILMPKNLKQDIFFKNKGRIPDLKYKLFSIAVFYCIRHFIEKESKMVICMEYTGQERLLKSEISRLFKIQNTYPNLSTIEFGRLSKQSPAHDLALSVFRKSKCPDLVLSRNQIESLLK